MSCAKEDSARVVGAQGRSRPPASRPVPKSEVGVIVGALTMILAGCPSMSRTERTTPAAAPTAAPEVPAPDVPRPELDRGQAAPGNVAVMR